jgi:hypothetical protein
MKRLIRLQSAFVIVTLSIACRCTINCSLFAAEPSREEASNSQAHTSLQVAVASLNRDVAKVFAFAWLFGGPGLGPLYRIEPITNELPRSIAGIVGAMQIPPTFSALEQLHCVNYLPNVTITNARAAKVPLDDEESLEVSSVLPADGLTAEINITALLKELEPTDNQARQRISLSASVRDGQAVVIAQAANIVAGNSTTNIRVRLVLVVAHIYDREDKPLHSWEERDAGTRIYWDVKPRRQPAIAPQHRRVDD